MPSNIHKSDIDLDLIFLPRETAKRLDVHYHVADEDISNRYEKYTSGTKADPTDIHYQDSDLSDLFQNIAVPLYTVLWTTTGGSASKSALDSAPGDVVLTWGTGLNMTINAGGSSGMESPFASNGTNADFQIKWSTFNITGVGSITASSGFTQNSFVDFQSNRTLTFDGDQTSWVQYIYEIDVTIRVKDDVSSEVTKRITVTTTNLNPN